MTYVRPTVVVCRGKGTQEEPYEGYLWYDCSNWNDDFLDLIIPLSGSPSAWIRFKNFSLRLGQAAVNPITFGPTGLVMNVTAGGAAPITLVDKYVSTAAQDGFSEMIDQLVQNPGSAREEYNGFLKGGDSVTATAGWPFIEMYTRTPAATDDAWVKIDLEWTK